MRHGYTTRLVKKGVQKSMIRELMGWSPDSNMISTYIHLAKTDVKEYQMLQLLGEDEKPPMVGIIKPKKTAMDKFNKQERDLIELREMVQGLNSHKNSI